MHRTVLLLLGLACSPLARADTGYTYVDEDDDGYPSDEDCNDADPDIHPDADEICDEIDNDCDGRVDDADDDVVGGETYADRDGDGFGNPDNTRCDAATGISDASDCDDLDAAVNPNAMEICDGRDNDCVPETSEDGLVRLGTATYTSITEAIAAANAGATVTVCDAVTEPVVIDKDITLQAPTGVVSVLRPAGETSILEVRGAAVDLVRLALRDGKGTLVGNDRLGGAVYASAGSELNVVDCELTGNTADHGGAMAVVESSLTLDGSNFERNTATGRGGALFLAHATTTIRQPPSFARNTAAYGGGIAQEGGAFLRPEAAEPEPVNIYRNRALVSGGGYALFVPEAGDTTLLASEIHLDENHSDESGGGLFVQAEAAVSIYGPYVFANTATNSGGGVHVEGAAVHLERVNMQINSAGQGGNLAVVDAEVLWDDLPSAILGTAALGGGLHLTRSRVEVVGNGQQVNIFDNHAELGGGAYLADEESVLRSTNVGWGQGGPEDNAEDDVYLFHVSTPKSYRRFGNPETFVCDGAVPECTRSESSGCGCGTTGPQPSWFLWLAMAGVRRRR